MTKKNFRDLKVAPTIKIKCVGCGIMVAKSEAKKYYWCAINESKNLIVVQIVMSPS